MNFHNYLAHTKDIAPTEHGLIEHLEAVANIARLFADKFQAGDWAYIAGVWHDLGKFSNDFQRYIRAPDNKVKVNHSSAGALLAIKEFKGLGRIFSYLIAGHHSGLPDWEHLSKRLQENEHLEKALHASIPNTILRQSLPSKKPSFSLLHLWIRMLFSCLVDADFLDTEAFMDIEKSRQRSNYPSLKLLKDNFDHFMSDKIKAAQTSNINIYRKQILEQCIDKGRLKPGFYTLTVPTGGGKTLSSMAFALEHALQHNKERVIYAIPYTSIIEQTAKIYRSIPGWDEAVIEHHSNLDIDNETHRSRLAAENWDAPVIVTTNVQLLESLFAVRTSRTRKLHNIANSIIVLDEVQQLPAEHLSPILSVLQELVDYYGVTCVLASATQPALTDIKTGAKLRTIQGLKEVTEIIKDPQTAYQQFRRVQIHTPDDNSPSAWTTIASNLLHYEQVLCVVNTRKDCRELFKLMPSGTFHLSALMCGEHRTRVIEEIKANLQNNNTVRVISTQLIEAGVDIDFPIVYRALAGADSIAQAAGRCNREGRLPLGHVHVFVPPNPAPKGSLRKGAQITRELLQMECDLLDPQTITSYFERFYANANSLDKEDIDSLLQKDANDLKIQFSTAAEKFKLIEDDAYIPVIVRYADSDHLLEQLQSDKISRYLLRKLQRYTVNIPKQIHQKLVNDGCIRETLHGLYVQELDALYDPVMGFLGGYQEYLNPENFIF